MARGLRNAEGLAFVPASNELWAVVNNRDQIPYPYHADITGDGVDDYGKVLQSYVDDNPPEEFVHVQQGADYGWPYANPDPSTAAGLNAMPFAPDFHNNPGWSVYPASRFTPVDKGIQAHSAPLGLSFLQDSQFPIEYRNGAVVALHGSWNRSLKTGYKVIYFPWNNATNGPGTQLDLVTGWLNEATQEAWGRPVDAVPDDNGNLFISDNVAGAIYKLAIPGGTPPDGGTDPLKVDSFSLIDPGTNFEIPGYEAVIASEISIVRSAFPAGYCLFANVSGAVESVVFAHKTNTRYAVESSPPYSIAGDVAGGGDGARRCNPWKLGLSVGSHRIEATPYDQNAGSGTPGASKVLTIKVK
jgi:hypothetical protein